MPLALIILAYLTIVTGLTGRWSQVSAAFEQDVMGGGTGGGFLQFLIGIIGIAIFFRVVDMPNAGRIFLGLVILVFLLQYGSQILPALESVTGSTATSSTSPGATPSSGTVAQAPSPAPTTPSVTPSGGGTGS